MKFKTLIYDIESTPDLSYTYGPKWKPILLKVKEPSYILSIAWKWRGQKTTHVMSLDQYKGFKKNPRCDKALLQDFAKVLEKADFIVAHNQKFDLPTIRTRMLFHDLEPLKQFKSSQDLCTLRLARKHFRLTSNRLNDLADFLGIGVKDKIDSDVWLSIVENNDRKSWAHMKRYNIKDVELTEEVYERLGKWDNRKTTVDGCTHCGSDVYTKKGWTHPSAAGWKFRKYKCSACGKKFIDKSDKRKIDWSSFA